jgi:hypothetical protein
MFRCNHCNREYGGIRGITIDRTIDLCPRCATKGKNSFPPPMRIRSNAPKRALVIAASSQPT